MNHITQQFFKKNKNKFIKTILFIITIDLLINYFYRQQLYIKGQQIIFHIQKSRSNLGTIFNQFITSVSQPVIVCVGIFILILTQKNKKHTLNVIIFILLNLYFTVLLKSFYSDPRPFWTSNTIQSFSPSCPKDYGNPSGHTWFTSVASLIGFIQYLPKFNKIYSVFISLILTILVAYSRMYLGAHSLNQVLLGGTLGYSFCALYYIGQLNKIIDDFLINFNKAPMLGWKKYILLFHSLYILAFIVTDKKINDNRQIYQSYSLALKDRCYKQVQPHSLNFGMLLASAMLVNLASGFAYGFDKMYFIEKGLNYLNGKWSINQQRYSESFGNSLYYIVQICCLLSGLFPACLIVYIFQDLGNVFVFTVLSCGAYISGYLYTGFCCDYLYTKGIISQDL